MLYQVDGVFKFYDFKAKYSLEGKEQEQFIHDKEDFERNLKENLRMNAEHKAMQDWFETHPMEPYMPQEIKVELPEITYEEIIHKDKEIERLNRVNKKKCGTSEDVKYYIATGQYPEVDHSLKALEIEDLKQENITLKIAQSEMIEQQTASILNMQESFANAVENSII